MKKTILLVLLGMSICFSSQAQRRNMLDNADFETLSGGNLTNWSLNGSQIFPTDASLGDIIVNGQTSLAVYGSGAISSDYSSVSLNCPRFFTVNAGDQFKFRFTADLVGVASTTINVVFQMNWGGDTGFLFNDVVTLNEGTHEYTITSKKAGDTGTIPMGDRSLFSIQFGKVPVGANLFIDDVELTNTVNNWTGNIKTNFNFQHPIDLLEFWTYGSYSAAMDKTTDPGYNILKATINGVDYGCVTGRCYIFNETANKHYQFEIVANASDNIDSSFITANNDGGFPAYKSSKFKLTTQKQTFLMDWPATAIPGGGNYYLDMQFPSTAPIGTNIYIYSWKVNEIIPLTGITFGMPDTAPIGTAVPVHIWANPTNADNAVDLVVTSGSGTVSNVNGEWFYTAQGGISTIKATSKINSSFTATKDVNSVTGLKNIFSENVSVYPTQTKDMIYIKCLESDFSVEIYSNIGQLVKSVKNVNSVSVKGLTSGMYIVKIKSGLNITAKKIQVL